jgi:hypothetical protein
MKYLFGLLLLAVVSFSARAEEISEAAVAGDWIITSPVYTDQDTNDLWEFHDGNFVQNLDGQRIPSGTYKVKNGDIVCQYWTIDVLEFGDGKMKAEMGGVVYTLEKQ